MTTIRNRPTKIEGQLLLSDCFVDGALANWIADRWQAGSDEFETTDPTTGEVIARVSCASPLQIDEAAQAATAAGATWAGWDGIDRAQVLWRMAGEIRSLGAKIGA